MGNSVVDGGLGMGGFDGATLERAERYCEHRGIELREHAAPAGQDGQVYQTGARNYIKVFARTATYKKECEAYRRLHAHRVFRVMGFNVPQLLYGSAPLGIIEISRVEPPFVLDFGKIELDQRPEDVWADDLDRLRDAWVEWEKKFYPHQWPVVKQLYNHFGARYGIWMLDLHPGNIRFVDSSIHSTRPES